MTEAVYGVLTLIAAASALSRRTRDPAGRGAGDGPLPLG